MTARFVTFEGLDGSGKSTHLRWATAWLEEAGLPCRATREPGGTELGQAIRDVFLDRRWGTLDGRVEAMLIFASRRQHLLEVIEPALAEGRTVLCDRFTDSTLAYQGYGRGTDLEIIEAVDRLATGGRVPDRTLLFDLPAREAQGRGQSHSRQASAAIDRLDAESLEFYRRVREGYLALSRAAPERFRIVDSSGPREATARQVRAALVDLLPETA